MAKVKYALRANERFLCYPCGKEHGIEIEEPWAKDYKRVGKVKIAPPFGDCMISGRTTRGRISGDTITKVENIIKKITEQAVKDKKEKVRKMKRKIDAAEIQRQIGDDRVANSNGLLT